VAQPGPKIHSRLVDWFAWWPPPRGRVGASRLALEALKRVLCQVNRETAAFYGTRFMLWAGTTYLAPFPRDRNEAEQVQHLVDGNDAPDLLKVDRGYRKPGTAARRTADFWANPDLLLCGPGAVDRNRTAPLHHSRR
jgi:hypothetical protein